MLKTNAGEIIGNVPGTSLLRLKAVQAKTGLCRTEIYMRMHAGTFPLPVKLGRKFVAWVSTEVEKWVQAQVAERNARQDRRADSEHAAA